MKVEHQVIVIYAVTKKHMVDIPVGAIKRFEAELIEYMDMNKPEVGKLIKSSGVLSDEVISGLESGIADFKKQFEIRDEER